MSENGLCVILLLSASMATVDKCVAARLDIDNVSSLLPPLYPSFTDLGGPETRLGSIGPTPILVSVPGAFFRPGDHPLDPLL